MWFNNACFVFNIVSVLLILSPCCLSKQHYHFRVEEAQYTRLCHTKKILTVNGLFPGPSITVNKGDTIYVTVYNRAKYNITIHWHGVKLPRYPWSDGPEYITQCPIQPGKKFKHKVIFSTEDSTLWWHAHSDWSRATVHGAIVIYPKTGVNYPFAKPYQEQTIILAEWWKKDIMEVLRLFRRSGGDPNVSDAYTINGQPGDLYPCSKQDTFKLKVLQGQHYLLRIVNAAMNDILFFAVAKHKLTVVAVDGGYTKPYTSDYITISPGQTMDCLLDANQEPGRYYMAARSYSSGLGVPFDNTTATAIVEYRDSCSGHIPLPNLPYYNDTKAAFSFIGSLRSLSNDDHPFGVPTDITTQIISTVSVNTFPCPDITNRTCEGPNTTRLAASMNNISFMEPSIPILEAYYYNIKGVFGRKFPSKPPLIFNFTADYLPLEYEVPKRGRQVKVVAYNSTVEIVYQGTNLVAGIDHPMHLHGYSFYMVGWGFGNFDKRTDPQSYNLVDPLYINTVTVPKNGWVAIRFKAANPGVWFLHCHFERHLTWGMETVIIVKNGNTPPATILPPPPDMPPCKI